MQYMAKKIPFPTMYNTGIQHSAETQLQTRPTKHLSYLDRGT